MLFVGNKNKTLSGYTDSLASLGYILDLRTIPQPLEHLGSFEYLLNLHIFNGGGSVCSTDTNGKANDMV